VYPECIDVVYLGSFTAYKIRLCGSRIGFPIPISCRQFRWRNKFATFSSFYSRVNKEIKNCWRGLPTVKDDFLR